MKGIASAQLLCPCNKNQRRGRNSEGFRWGRKDAAATATDVHVYVCVCVCIRNSI